MQVLAAVELVLLAQQRSSKPMAVVLAGHNGSGKSTLWYRHGLADRFEFPLVNADRMMLSILPESEPEQPLPTWAQRLRDKNLDWMIVAQKGVQSFVSQAMLRQVPFATETVFSHWVKRDDGTFESKIDMIEALQNNGYYVLLLFVGLSSPSLSIARVKMRSASGGHDVPVDRLLARFPRTQLAVQAASSVADATIMVDNSRTAREAFTVCRVQMGEQEQFDWRATRKPTPPEIQRWLDIVSPR